MKKDNIHDKFIKSILGETKTAKSFLENYLPKEIIPLIDLNYLKPIKDSFVDSKLKEHFTDLIYKTKTKDKRDVYIYTLFEHKSYYDKFSVIQLLKYVALCYDKYKSNNMPIVIPLLLYNGEEEWKSVNDFLHLFYDIDENFKKYIPNFNFELYDFIREEKIIGNDELKTMMVMLKSRINPKFLNNLNKIVNYLYLNSYIKNNSILFLLYTTHEKNKDLLMKMIEKNFKGDDIMSVADALRREGIQIGEEKGIQRGREEGIQIGEEKGIQRGREEGIQIGEEKGLEKGLEKGREEVVKNMLLKGLDINMISEITNLSIDKINEIKNSLDK
jgi:predicted transposase/invertase (TIGR01784 family)